MRRLLAAAAAAMLAAALLSVPSVSAQPDNAPVIDDIDGDGDGDLLVGVPNESLPNKSRVGAVHAIYSNGDRLTTSGNQVLRQNDLPNAKSERDDLFGSAADLIDIDDDGFADAIVGSSGESRGLQRNSGAFHVIPGSSEGLDTSEAVTYTQGGDLPDAVELEDFFGFNIASGDFDDDGFGDVVVSAPFEDVNGRIDAGAVIVIPGSAQGLDTARATMLSQAHGLAGTAQADAFLGWAMISGNFNGDRFDDMAFTIPGRDTGGANRAGAVVIAYGSKSGLSADGSRMFSQAGPIADAPEANDLFGFSVAASDMNCDGIDDLLVGAPNETLGPDDVVAGMVHVLLGSTDGVTRVGDRTLVQGRRGVAGEIGFNQFGASLVGGKFNGDKCGDVVAGAHTTDIGGDGFTLCVEDPGCRSEAGAVVVVYGSRSWPTIGGTANFSQRGNVKGVVEADDWFGRTLASLDIDADDRFDDLVVGVPHEDIKGRRDAGSINVLHGSPRGIRISGNYQMSQAGALKGIPQVDDQFSSTLGHTTS